MKYPKIQGDRQGNDVARIVGEAKVRALQNVDAPYLSASGPGFFSRKSGEFQNVTLHWRSPEPALDEPNLVSIGLGSHGGVSLYHLTLRNDKFAPSDGEIKRFREKQTDYVFPLGAFAPSAFGAPHAAIEIGQGVNTVPRLVVGNAVRPSYYRYRSEDFTWVTGEFENLIQFNASFNQWGQQFVRPRAGGGVEDVTIYPRTRLAVGTYDKAGPFDFATFENRQRRSTGETVQFLTPDLYTGTFPLPALPAPKKPSGIVTRDGAYVVATRMLAADWISLTLRCEYHETFGSQRAVFSETYVYDSQDFGKTWVRRDTVLFDLYGGRGAIGSGVGTIELPWPSFGETASYTPMPATPDYCITHMSIADEAADGGRRNVMVKVFRDWSFEELCPHPGYELYPNYTKHFPFSYDERLFDLTLKGARIFQALPNPFAALSGYNFGYDNSAIHLFVSTDLGNTWQAKVVPHTAIIGTTAGQIDASVARVGAVFPLGASTLGYIRYEVSPARHVLMVSKDLGDTWYDYAIVSEGLSNRGAVAYYGSMSAGYRGDHHTAALLPTQKMPADRVEPLPWRRDYRIEYTPDTWEAPE